MVKEVLILAAGHVFRVVVALVEKESERINRKVCKNTFCKIAATVLRKIGTTTNKTVVIRMWVQHQKGVRFSCAIRAGRLAAKQVFTWAVNAKRVFGVADTSL